MGLKNKLKQYAAPVQEYKIEVLDEVVKMRPLSLKEFNEWGEKHRNKEKEENSIDSALDLFLRSCVNENGEREATEEYLQLLKNLPPEVCIELANQASVINKLTVNDSVENKAKN